MRLVQQIIAGQQDEAVALLSSGGAIWATNVLLFALWYWELDGGGPFARAQRPPRPPDQIHIRQPP